MHITSFYVPKSCAYTTTFNNKLNNKMENTRWSDKETQVLMGYVIQSDEERMQDTYEYAHHMTYKEGNHPEFKERTLSASIKRIRNEVKIKRKESKS